MSSLEKNLHLSETQYNSLLKALKLGDTTLFKQLFTKESQHCIDFLRRSYQVDHDKAYDITIEAIIVMRQRMVDDKVAYGNIKALFFQIAKHLYFKSLRTKSFQSIDETYELSDIDDLPIYSEEEINLLTKALARINKECQKILSLFYYQNQKLYDIADSMGKSHDAIRKQKERCINGLVDVYKQMTG